MEWRHEIGAVLEQVGLVGVQKRKLVFDLVRCQAVPWWQTFVYWFGMFGGLFNCFYLLVRMRAVSRKTSPTVANCSGIHSSSGVSMRR